jgi:hypothetical protein
VIEGLQKLTRIENKRKMLFFCPVKKSLLDSYTVGMDSLTTATP